MYASEYVDIFSMINSGIEPFWLKILGLASRNLGVDLHTSLGVLAESR